MSLTPEEEAELAALGAEFAAKQSPAAALTPQEEAELAALEAEQNGVKRVPVSKAESLKLGGAQGITFGLADELAPYAVKLMGKIDGRDIPLAEAEAATKETFANARADNPWSFTAGEIAGGALPFVKAGNLAAKAIKGTGAMANIGRGAVAAGAPSAVYGYTTGDEGERGENAVVSGVLGTILGGVVPAVGAAKTALRNRPFKDPIVSTVNDILNAHGLSKEKGLRSAMQQLARAKADDALESINEAIPLLEQGGEATKSIAMGAGRKGGEGGRIIGQYAEEAMAPETIARKAGDVVSKHLDDPGLDLTAGLEEFTRAVRDRAKPAYKAAYDAVPDVPYEKVSGILGRLDDVELKNVFEYAGKMARREGRTIGLKGEDGAIKSLSSEALDYISRAIREPAAFGDKPLGKGLISFNNEISRDLRNVLKHENTAWGKVVAEYSDAIGIQDAAEMGRRFSPSSSAKVLSDATAAFRKLNGPEKEAFKMAFGENIFGQINKNPSAFLRQVRSPQYVKALKEVMPADQVDDIVRQAEAQFQTLGRVRDVSRNSVTSNALAAMGNQTREDAIAGTAEAAATGNVMGVLKQMLGERARSVTDRFLGSPETAAYVAKGVTTAPRDLAATPEGNALLQALLAKPVKKTLPASKLEKFLADERVANALSFSGQQAIRRD